MPNDVPHLLRVPCLETWGARITSANAAHDLRHHHGQRERPKKHRQSATHALSRLADVEALLVVLRERGADTQPVVIHTLGRMNDERAVEPLLALLRAPAPQPAADATETPAARRDSMQARASRMEAKHSSVQALESLLAPDALEPLLLDLVREGDITTVIAVLPALVRIGSQHTLAALRELQLQYPTSTSMGRYISTAMAQWSQRLDQGQARIPD